MQAARSERIAHVARNLTDNAAGPRSPALALAGACPMSRPPRSLRPLIREVTPVGWFWERLGSGHIRFWHPSTPLTVVASATSADVNGYRILRRQLAKALEAGRP